MGKTVLYTLTRQGKIPANKVGKKWTFEKDQLDKWVRSNQPIESFFTNLDFNIESNEALREPQRDAYLRVSEFFSCGKNKAIIQIPVGCGKSGLAALLPLGMARGRILIISPNLTIKDGLYEAMDITNRQKCFWRKTGTLPDAQMIAGPLTAHSKPEIFPLPKNRTSSLQTFINLLQMLINGSHNFPIISLT